MTVARREEGFTLPEVMLTLSIGIVVLLAAMSVLSALTRQHSKAQRRATSIASGRLALDEVVRRLRSQACVQPNDTTILTPIVSANGSSVTFYSDFTDGSGLPDRHTLTVDTAGTLTDTTVKGAGTRQTVSFPGSGQLRQIASRIVGNGVDPIFTYYTFNTANPPTATQPLNSLASPTVASADLPRIARIVVTMRANPEGSADPKLATTLQDEVFVRLADPDDSAPSPKCV